MSGVEILSTAEVVTAFADWSWSSFLTAFSLMAFIAALIGIGFGAKERKWKTGFCMFLSVSLIAGGFIGFICGKLITEPIEYTTHYKVTIDESVSMAEFIEKYEIIDQDGKIYIVRERE